MHGEKVAPICATLSTPLATVLPMSCSFEIEKHLRFAGGDHSRRERNAAGKSELR